MNGKRKKKERNSNIELARIFAILGVIVLHYNSFATQGALDHVQAGSINFYVCHVLEATFICAVNLFILISGYFLCETKQRSLWKPIEIIVQVMIFSCVLNIIYPLVVSKEPQYIDLWVLLPDNYYAILYCTLYLISPYINTIFSAHSEKDLRRYMVLSLLLFSVFPTVLDLFNGITGMERNGLSTVSIFGSLKGYSIVNFVLLYEVGAYLRKCNPRIKTWSWAKLITAIGICIVVLTFWSTSVQDRGIAWSYCNPIVIVMAALYFVLFSKFSFYSRVINTVAKGVFSIYLLHSFFILRLECERYATQSIWRMVGHMAVSVIGIFCACWIGHAVYYSVSKPVFRHLSKKYALIAVKPEQKLEQNKMISQYLD